MRIRIIDTGSHKHAVQVVTKVDRDLVVHQHFGTFTTEAEKQQLLTQAHEYIRQETGQEDIFSSIPSAWSLDEVEIIQSQPLYLYRLLGSVYDHLGFPAEPLIKDLVIARLYQPSSKRETGEILAETFGVSYSLKTIYRHLKKAMDKGFKDNLQKALINYAKNDLGDNLKLVFYDVTTLAFSNQAKTTLKDFGYSKDHRSQDTQVVVGLVVNRDGFPLYFDIFSGKTFEGHTFIKIVNGVKQLIGQPELVVVADAGMFSQTNLDELNQAKIKFVVGAKLASFSPKTINQLSGHLNQIDGSSTETIYKNYRLITDYSEKRAQKDLRDLDKQWAKAEEMLTKPDKITRRYRFLKGSKKANYALNETLKAKALTLRGMKGYLTNTNLNATVVATKYHDLWQVEKAFRLTKSDLEARPIFLQLEATIKAHLTIVFAGLAIAKLLELQTQTSIHQILKQTTKILTHTVRHKQTGQTTIMVTATPTEAAPICGKLNNLYSFGY